MVYFPKNVVMLGAGAVRNRTYRRGRTVSCASLVSIKFLANRPLNVPFLVRVPRQTAERKFVHVV